MLGTSTYISSTLIWKFYRKVPNAILISQLKPINADIRDLQTACYALRLRYKTYVEELLENQNKNFELPPSPQHCRCINSKQLNHKSSKHINLNSKKPENSMTPPTQKLHFFLSNHFQVYIASNLGIDLNRVEYIFHEEDPSKKNNRFAFSRLRLKQTFLCWENSWRWTLGGEKWQIETLHEKSQQWELEGI